MAPDHLALYLSNRCNLACSYCYVSVNEGPTAFLDFEQLKRSVDFFFAQVPSPTKKITFLGGEPFLNFPLLERIASYAREAGGEDVVLQTFTNGTLITSERLEALARLGVFVTVSLDGKSGTNDAHRRFLANGNRSVLEDVLRKLEGASKRNLGVSLVFTAETVGELLGNIDFFYRMGFGRITFNPELYETWPDEKLAVLRAVMQGFRRYYRTILERGMPPFVIQVLFSVLENGRPNGPGWWHDCHNVVLGPDERFYACDKPLAFPIGQAQGNQVGSPAAGLDWKAREAHYERAIRFVEENSTRSDHAFCPMGVFFFNEHAGKDPVPALRNFERVAEVFAGGLLDLVRDLRENAVFQELYVQARIA